MSNRANGITLALMLMTGCTERGPIYTDIDLDVDVRLNGVEEALDYSSFMAVGADGTVVHYFDRGHPYGREFDVETWHLGGGELWAVEALEDFSGFVGTDTRLWFVVGGAGRIHIGVEDGGSLHDAPAAERFSWTAQEVIVDADLYGIANISDGGAPRVFVVGDEVMLTGVRTNERGTYWWTEIPAPAGGWGRLRDISAGGIRQHEQVQTTVSTPRARQA